LLTEFVNIYKVIIILYNLYLKMYNNHSRGLGGGDQYTLLDKSDSSSSQQLIAKKKKKELENAIKIILSSEKTTIKKEGINER